ncbi:complement component 1 Q subcomponent-binding protein, mitochondrial isoform X1 [Ovis aries]|uniref:complement component 1 Q subcomponent-binding protein, mitochondrial isoform X1 n=1 Tax=Ovis aries TaxID=9940 RepID=UPI0029528A7E|nr:complement component 1 Q subcomponent-binding protein, mitochondrial isoform X1 [Ovis aries]
MFQLLRCVPRVLGSAVAGLRAAAPSLPLLQPASRPCARPFGLLSVRAGSVQLPGLLKPRGPCACGCGCSGLHTEGDKAFVDFLSDEIKEEKKIQKYKSLPKMSGGWELEVNGTEAKLVRKVAGEKITVTFNINNSIPPAFGGEEEEPSQGQKAEEQEPELTSTPNFVVEVTKDGSSKALVLDCHYPEDEVCRVESWRPGGRWWGASRGLSWFHLADINIFWLRAAKLGRLVGGKGTRLKSEFQAVNNPFSSPESGLSWKTFLFRQILSLFRLDKRMTRVTFSPSRK